jgi:hypothetical protein
MEYTVLNVLKVNKRASYYIIDCVIRDAFGVRNKKVIANELEVREVVEGYKSFS